MRPAVVSGIVTGDASVSYWPFFFTLVSSNSPRCLCESLLGPVLFSLLKWRMWAEEDWVGVVSNCTVGLLCLTKLS